MSTTDDDDENQDVCSNVERWALRRKIAYILSPSDPPPNKTYTCIAMGWGLLIQAAIFVAISVFLISSLPEYTETKNTQTKILEGLEWCCVALFTLELGARFTVSTEKRRFFTKPLNIVDALAIFPAYVELITSLFLGNTPVDSLVVLRVLRIFRALRIFRLQTLTSSLTIVVRTLESSVQSIILLAFLLAIILLLFSSAIYLAEQSESTFDFDLEAWVRSDSGEPSPFQHIPESFWWTMVTLTTVGYGDAVPVTTTGRVLGTATVLTGLLILTLPIILISDQFQESYEANYIEQERDKIMKIMMSNLLDSKPIPVSRKQKMHSLFVRNGPWAPGHWKTANKIIRWVMFFLVLAALSSFTVETFPSILTGRRAGLKTFLDGINAVTSVVFTVEWVVRFAVTPSKRCFLKSFMNWIDFWSFAPFYMHLVWKVCCAEENSEVSGSRLVRTLRMLRVVRVLRLAKYNSHIDVVGYTMRASLDGLVLLVILLLMCALLFSSLIWLIEQSNGATFDKDRKLWVRDGDPTNFQSIPATMWFSVVTITTVGYGDIVPFTSLGKIVTCVMMVFSLIVLAFPLLIIGAKYKEALAAIHHIEALKKEMQEQEELDMNIEDAPSTDDDSHHSHVARKISAAQSDVISGPIRAVDEIQWVGNYPAHIMSSPTGEFPTSMSAGSVRVTPSLEVVNTGYQATQSFAGVVAQPAAVGPTMHSLQHELLGYVSLYSRAVERAVFMQKTPVKSFTHEPLMMIELEHAGKRPHMKFHMYKSAPHFQLTLHLIMSNDSVVRATRRLVDSLSLATVARHITTRRATFMAMSLSPEAPPGVAVYIPPWVEGSNTVPLCITSTTEVALQAVVERLKYTVLTVSAVFDTVPSLISLKGNDICQTAMFTDLDDVDPGASVVYVHPSHLYTLLVCMMSQLGLPDTINKGSLATQAYKGFLQRFKLSLGSGFTEEQWRLTYQSDRLQSHFLCEFIGKTLQHTNGTWKVPNPEQENVLSELCAPYTHTTTVPLRSKPTAALLNSTFRDKDLLQLFSDCHVRSKMEANQLIIEDVEIMRIPKSCLMTDGVCLQLTTNFPSETKEYTIQLWPKKLPPTTKAVTTLTSPLGCGGARHAKFGRPEKVGNTGFTTTTPLPVVGATKNATVVGRSTTTRGRDSLLSDMEGIDVELETDYLPPSDPTTRSIPICPSWAEEEGTPPPDVSSSSPAPLCNNTRGISASYSSVSSLGALRNHPHTTSATDGSSLFFVTSESETRK